MSKHDGSRIRASKEILQVINVSTRHIKHSLAELKAMADTGNVNYILCAQSLQHNGMSMPRERFQPSYLELRFHMRTKTKIIENGQCVR